MIKRVLAILLVLTNLGVLHAQEFRCAVSVNYQKLMSTTQSYESSDKKVFEKEITIDFDGIEFDEPGVYRYIITEKTDAGAGIFYDVAADALTTDGDCKRTLDVYVEDISGETKELKISAYIMYDGEIKVAPPAVAPGESYTSWHS